MIGMIRFFNTLSGKIEPFVPIREGQVGLYTCGPTVYDYPHIGNWRAYIFEDLLKRFLIASGFKVIHVMNLTDVDDKTIRGASLLGLKLEDFTKSYIEAFFRGQVTLNIKQADHYPRATQHIKEMVDLIKKLLEKGFAYYKDGSVYFSIERFPEYGKLSKIRLEELKPGQRSDADEYAKESVHDFALWKKAKEDEPFWETELGPGRPGWHIECSAMSSKYLGWHFDIHCGGVDNIFPHHENEIAQSEAATGHKFVNYWLHCHHLVVDGEKMSKSKGNFFTLEDLMDRKVDPLDLRFLLLSAHYRKMINFTFEALAQAQASRRRILDFLVSIEEVQTEGSPGPEILSLIDEARHSFRQGLEDDLNISEALAALFSFIKNANIFLAEHKINKIEAGWIKDFLSSIDNILAILPEKQISGTLRQAGAEELTNLERDIILKIELRQKARAEKNFQLADQIRQELLAMGIVLEDTKDGVRWKKITPKS